MLVHGIRGDQLPTGGADADEDMTEDELSLYGVDWEVIGEGIHPSEVSSGPTSTGQSWVGRTGPPEHLNSVEVDPPLEPGYAEPAGPNFPAADVGVEGEGLIHYWLQALVYMQLHTQ